MEELFEKAEASADRWQLPIGAEKSRGVEECAGLKTKSTHDVTTGRGMVYWYRLTFCTSDGNSEPFHLGQLPSFVEGACGRGLYCYGLDV